MLSQTVEYALRAMSHLAPLGGESATSEAIARATHVPHGYLTKVMRDLVRAGLVRSSRGPHGGFALSSEPGDITILDVVNAVDPIQRILACPLGNPAHVALCPLHRCIDDAAADLERGFGKVTLESVLTSARKAGVCPGLVGKSASTQEEP
jgi:Rrf2 family protein